MNLKHNEGTFSGHDNLDLYYQEWTQDNAKEHLVFAHGLGEHSGRYNHLIEALADLPINFYGLDHRGHGKSEGVRGHVNSWHDFTRDLGIFISNILQKVGQEKLILLGHSMGGNIAINYALDHQEHLKGLILSSPGLEPGLKINPVKKGLGKMMSKLYPKFSQSNGIVVEHLSHDKTEVDKYVNDPLVHDRVTARWFTEFVESGEYAIEKAGTLSIPIIITQGMQDKLINPEATKAFYANIKYNNKKLLLYDDLYHETYNELEEDRNEVLSKVRQWIEKNFF